MSPGRRRSIISWGRDRREGIELYAERLEAASTHASLSRGLGRSYGDAGLPASSASPILNTTLADRLLFFQEDDGAGRAIVRAEAGLSLAELHRVFIPRGYFSPVTPGTQFVTLGGMVAADVHGKNQHIAGNFGDHLHALRLRAADGRVLDISPAEHPELFAATIGGMGLTGHILEVEFALDRIPSRFIYQEALRIPNLESFEEELRSSAERFPFTMGWIDALSKGDSLGRGVLYRGRFAEPEELPRRLPRPPRAARLSFDFPSWVLNPLSIRAFNELKYRSQPPRLDARFVTLEEFFYPLDAIHEWNRMYGLRGFTQYQCVLPRGSSTRRVLEALAESAAASFLCVIKDFDRIGRGTLSFPMPGMTLAIDLPRAPHIRDIVAKLNRIVIEEGGRVYLAKDRYTTREEYLAMDPRVAEFEAIRDECDPQRVFRSAQSVRIFGDEEERDRVNDEE